MDFFRKLWAWLFRDNKMLLKFAVQDIAYREFQKHPDWKTATIRAINSLFATVTANTTAEILIENLKSNLNVSNLTPPEQELVKGMIDNVYGQWLAYVKTANIVSDSQKYQSLAELMGWIRDVAR